MKKETKNDAQAQEETKNDNQPPRYLTKKTEFFCPLGTNIMWHHGLHYKDCPLVSSQRDMPSCNGCKLRWSGVDKNKVANNERNRNSKKSNPIVENAHREDIPNIGRAYSSDED